MLRNFFKMKNIIVTGGCGFIGSELVRQLVHDGHNILNIDCMTYASNPESLNTIQEYNNYTHIRKDIQDKALKEVFNSFKPEIIFNLAAESHVDNSIENPDSFINTNINGTYNLLNISKNYLDQDITLKNKFRFIHISTDEVFGSLSIRDESFKENSQYKPNSPYSASKASSDHLVHAYCKTFSIPSIITNCSNNFGPWQNVEKLIPKVISCALNKQKIPIYGDGKNIRDWIYVVDHVAALKIIMENNSDIGLFCRYNIGANNEIENIEIVNMICTYLDSLMPFEAKYSSLIDFVGDRLGHDFRYSIDSSKIKNSLGWEPRSEFKDALHETIDWYLNYFK